MAASTNIYGFNIGGNNNSFDQRGHFYRAFLNGNVSGMLVKQNSTPNMTVLVEHGSALLNKNTTSASVAEIKSDTSVTIDTANTSNPRIDTVVIYEDTSVAIPTVENDYWQDGAGGRFKIVSLPGTAGAVPVALSDANIQTAIGAGKPWTRLADVTVPTNSTTIINSNIADMRVRLSSVIADGAVTAAKMVNGMVKNRQGGTTGDASWLTNGTSNTDTSAKNAFFQAGSLASSATSGADVTVTFPVAYNQAPLVFLTVGSSTGSNQYATANSITTTGFKFRQVTGTTTETVMWLAIGQ